MELVQFVIDAQAVQAPLSTLYPFSHAVQLHESLYVVQFDFAVQHFAPPLDNTPVEHEVHLQLESLYVEQPLIVVQHFEPPLDKEPLEHVVHLHVESL